MIPDLVLGLPKALFGAFIQFVAVPAHQRFLPPVAALPILFSSSPRFAEPFHFFFVDGLSLTGKPTYALTSHLIIDHWRESVTNSLKGASTTSIIHLVQIFPAREKREKPHKPLRLMGFGSYLRGSPHFRYGLGYRPFPFNGEPIGFLLT
jgi:hypothetical protein